MHYVIAAILKPGAEDQLINYHAEFSEHIGASARNLRIGGVLRNRAGHRAGYLAILEGDTIEDATAWLRESPYYKADLYERADVFEYQIEVGRLD